MPTLSANTNVTLSLTDYDSVTITCRGPVLVEAVSGLGVTGKIAEFAGTKTFGPFSPAGSLKLTAYGNDAQYEVADGVAPSSGSGGGGTTAVATAADLLIYGATFGGIMAAISAKKQGLNPIIVEPRDDVGGMVTSGIMFTDAYATPKYRGAITGLADKFYADAASYFNRDQQDYFFNYSYGLESKTAKKLLLRAVAKYGIPMFTNAKLVSIVKSGAVLKSCTFDTIGTITAKQYHDATYCGDLMAMAGCDFIVGREASATYSESAYKAGFYVDPSKQPANRTITAMSWAGGIVTVATAWATAFSNGEAVNITISGATPTGYNGTYVGSANGAGGYTFALASDPGAMTVAGTIRFNVDPYVTIGSAGSGLIPFVQAGTGQAEGSSSPYHQAMGYRLAITDSASNKVAYTLPANYNPAQYELLRRWFKGNGQGLTAITDVLLFQLTLLSDTVNKQDVNNKQFLGLDYPHPESTEWATASWARRAEIEENIRQYTLGLFYFWQNDASVPAAVRASVASYGWCADEYRDTGNMPRYPYPRQGRRMIGASVTNGVDLTTISAATAMAMSYYTYDEHTCQFVANGGVVQLEGGLTGASAVGARIPQSYLVPKIAQCTNLTVGFCGSSSQVAFSALRLEPIMGVIGEAAGVMAALAIRYNLPVQTVPAADIAKDLNLFGWNDFGALSVSTDGIYSAGSSVTAGTWATAATTVAGTTSIASCSATSGTNTLTLTPSTTALKNSYYDIYLKWLDTNSVSVRGSPTITVTANALVTTLVVNESGNGDGGDWYFLGRYYMRKGSAANNNIVVTHDNTTNSTNVVGAKFVAVAGKSSLQP